MNSERTQETLGGSGRGGGSAASGGGGLPQQRQTTSERTAVSALQRLLDGSRSAEQQQQQQQPGGDDDDDSCASSVHDGTHGSMADDRGGHSDPHSGTGSSIGEESSSAAANASAGKAKRTACSSDVPMSFPQKLMEILEDKNHADVISWLPHGKAFIIYKKKKFEAEVMPKYFKQSKFTSFTRKLNRWGFTRVKKGPEAGAYYHEFFKRGNMRLSMQMCCQKAVQEKSTPRPSQSESSPFDPTTAAAIAAKMELMNVGNVGSRFAPHLPYNPVALAAQSQVQSGIHGQMQFNPMAAAAAQHQAQSDMMTKLREAEAMRQRQQHMLEAAHMMELQRSLSQKLAPSSAGQPNRNDIAAEVALQYAIKQSLNQSHPPLATPSAFAPQPMSLPGYTSQNAMHNTIMQNAMKSLYQKQQNNDATAGNQSPAPNQPTVDASAAIPPAGTSSQSLPQQNPPATSTQQPVSADAARIFQKQLELYREREREKIMARGGGGADGASAALAAAAQQLHPQMAAAAAMTTTPQASSGSEGEVGSPRTGDKKRGRTKRASAA